MPAGDSIHASAVEKQRRKASCEDVVLCSMSKERMAVRQECHSRIKAQACNHHPVSDQSKIHSQSSVTCLTVLHMVANKLAYLLSAVGAQAVQARGELLVEEMDDLDETEELSHQESSAGTAAAVIAPSMWSRQQPPQPYSSSSNSANPCTLRLSPPAAAGGGGGCGGGPLTAGEPLPVSSMREVDMLLWGSIGGCPSPAWCQGFVFSNTPGLWWGLVQYQGGPCGVLAAVQGHLMATLMEQVCVCGGGPGVG